VDDEVLEQPGSWISVPSIESDTRGSRRMLRIFRCSAFRWADTISSPSSPTHTHDTCGDPSPLSGTRCASRPDSIIARPLSGRATRRD
jgi:hypothetical protein